MINVARKGSKVREEIFKNKKIPQKIEAMDNKIVRKSGKRESILREPPPSLTRKKERQSITLDSVLDKLGKEEIMNRPILLKMILRDTEKMHALIIREWHRANQTPNLISFGEKLEKELREKLKKFNC